MLLGLLAQLDHRELQGHKANKDHLDPEERLGCQDHQVPRGLPVPRGQLAPRE